MFLIFEDSEIINLDNVACIEADQISDDEINVLIVTTAINFYAGDRLFEPEHYNSFHKRFAITKEKWFALLDMIKQDQNTLVLTTGEFNT